MTEDHITVCLCTYQRPASLARLLRALLAQETQGLFTFSIVVVDNDKDRSAEDEVKRIQRESSIQMEYHVEPRKNIAHARNMTLDKATGNLVAFVDDDEVPVERWLLELYTTLNESEADGVLGALLPRFEEPPPPWVTKYKLYFWRNERPVEGVVQKRGNTGNVLLRRSILDGGLRFNPAFGQTGGEDSDFFQRLIERGFVFVSSSKGLVYEEIPPERTRARYQLKRNVLQGCTAVRRFRLQDKSRGFMLKWLAKALIGIVVYSVCLPFCAVAGRGIALRFFMKVAYFIGVVAEYAGMQTVVERSDLAP